MSALQLPPAVSADEFVEYFAAPGAVLRFRDMDALVSTLGRRKKLIVQEPWTYTSFRWVPPEAVYAASVAERDQQPVVRHDLKSRGKKHLDAAASLENVLGPMRDELDWTRERFEDREEKLKSKLDSILQDSDAAQYSAALSDIKALQARHLALLAPINRDIELLELSIDVLRRRAESIQPKRLGNTSVFEEAFVTYLAQFWRDQVGEPARSKSGIFVDFVRICWGSAGLTEKSQDFFGEYIARLAQRENWGGSRGKKTRVNRHI